MAKSDKFYFDNFKACAAIAKDEASYLVECLENYDHARIEEMIKTMHEYEHSADIKKHELTETLAKAFITPIDREDLDLLSHQLDNVCDTIEEIIQKFYIYDIKEIHPAAIEFAKHLIKGCESIELIMAELENFKRSKTMHSLIVSCNDVEEECDKLYLSTMRDLTINSKDPITTVSWYKIIDCFEVCADACEHVSDCVGSIIMKNT